MLKWLRARISQTKDRLLKRKWEAYVFGLQQKGLKLGSNVQFAEDIFLDAAHCFLISIGNNVTFAPGVKLIAHDASTKKYLGFTRIGLIRIHDNCFIGNSVIVLPGVSIGPDSIVGAGSVVTRDIPAGSVAVGNPARVVCSLSDYKDKRQKQAQAKGVFGTEYLIENLTPERRQEVVKALESECGFIV